MKIVKIILSFLFCTIKFSSTAISEEPQNIEIREFSETKIMEEGAVYTIDKEYDENLMKVWEQVMFDFKPSDILTYEIPSSSREIMFEIIETVPALVKGAFVVLSSSNQPYVDFYIYDPTNKTVFQKKGRKEVIFNISAKIPGVYTFTISNNKFFDLKKVMFAIHVDKQLRQQDLTSLEGKLEGMESSLDELMAETKFSRMRQTDHSSKLVKTHQRLFWVTLIETLLIVITVFWQIYYIRGLLENKRVI